MPFIDKREILDEKTLNRTIARITHEILENNKGPQNLVLIGIRDRGDHLANRIAKIIEDIEGVNVPVGIIDITLYRDDIGMKDEHFKIQKTEIPFSVTDKTVVLVDDVIFTGRTIRAALDAIMDLGRPKTVRLAVLIDRGNRELPIEPDFIGRRMLTTGNEIIRVMLREEDSIDKVLLGEEE